MNENINVLLLDLPCSIRGFVKRHPEGYTIVLNAKLSREANIRTLEHEIEHIRCRDLETEIIVSKVEMERHNGI